MTYVLIPVVKDFFFDVLGCEAGMLLVGRCYRGRGGFVLWLGGVWLVGMDGHRGVLLVE